MQIWRRYDTDSESYKCTNWRLSSINREKFFCVHSVILDKEGKNRYFALCEKTIQDQIAAFDQ